MASVNKTPSGKWRVVWRVSKSRQKSKSFKLKGDASRFKAKIENERAQSTYLDTKALTWADFRARYSEDVVSLLKPATASTYRWLH